jgi:hypothetical protein
MRVPSSPSDWMLYPLGDLEGIIAPSWPHQPGHN